MPYFLTPRWMLGHLTVLALFVLFLRLGWWQLISALNGHVISIGYALQWPTFAMFGVFLWIRTVRLHAPQPPAQEAATEPEDLTPPPLTWTFERHPPAADAHQSAQRRDDTADGKRADSPPQPREFHRPPAGDRKDP